MKATSIDTLRVNIFQEIVNMDSEKLNKVYDYVKSLTSKTETDTKILKELLDASADYAVQAHKRGDFHTTQDVVNKLGKEMGWI